MNELLKNIVCPISKKKLEILIFEFNNEEVFQWFEASGYQDITFQSSNTYYDLFKRRIVDIGFLEEKNK